MSNFLPVFNRKADRPFYNNKEDKRDMGRKYLVLIADDIKENLLLLRKIIESMDYNVQEAANGKEGLEIARLQKPDLIISDILMPVMDGFQFCREVKEDDELKNIPFIFYTATYTDKKDKEFALKLGADKFIIKPTESDEFIKIIQGVTKDVEKGKIKPKKPSLNEEKEIFKLYSERLINKLEKKMLDLEKEITERKQVEKELKSSEERLKTIYEFAPDAFYMNDLKGKFIDGNKAAEKITGYKRKELIGASFLKLKLLSPMQIPKAAALLARNALGKSTGPDEFILNRKDGTQVPVEIMTHPVKIKGQTIVLSIARDITEPKQAEEERQKLQMRLQQAQKMEAIGTLAGGIAHDFNNILSAIIGYTELALDDIEEETLLHNNLQEVFKAGKRARILVKQILTFSRQREQESQPVQVKLIVKEALKLLRASMPTTIEIHQDIQSDSVVLADSTQIHQVLMNLCANASYAMREKGGVLAVKLEDVELDTYFASKHPDVKPGLYMKLTVGDTGHGMSPEILERAFDPFFTAKRKGEGTGIGLSVVHGIVKEHRGIILAYSEQGKGSTFNVFLPVTEAEAESDTRKEKSIPKGTEHILFIDDEQTLVDLGKQMLESLGYKVTAKTNSLEALELFKSQPARFDLVITDMTMPKLTGEELAIEVLAIQSDIPVILCTGFSTEIDKKKAKAIGIRAFLLKPIFKQQIAETVRKVLDLKKEGGG